MGIALAKHGQEAALVRHEGLDVGAREVSDSGLEQGHGLDKHGMSLHAAVGGRGSLRSV